LPRESVREYLRSFIRGDRSHCIPLLVHFRIEAGKEMDQAAGKELRASDIHPRHPERICWGCEKLCPTNNLMCRETRAAHPVELYGEGWWEVSNGLPDATEQTK